MVTAIMRLGLTAFPIGPRNTAHAVASLLKRTGTLLIFVSEDEPMQALARESAEELAQDGLKLEIAPMIKFEDITGKKVTSKEDGPIRKLGQSEVTVILHSSGMGMFLFLRGLQSVD